MQSSAAVNSGHWILMRYNPALAAEGKNPLMLDSRAPKIAFRDYACKEVRYNVLTRTKPEEARRLMELAETDAKARWRRVSWLRRAPLAGVWTASRRREARVGAGIAFCHDTAGRTDGF
ncbi:MAG: hypothetical protein JXQ71_03575 [Verrucomicrobia bacterium]|nr:hypothetical protein [Verrucomicrobiota bacterium]